jgi:hypothetical protein
LELNDAEPPSAIIDPRTRASPLAQAQRPKNFPRRIRQQLGVRLDRHAIRLSLGSNIARGFSRNIAFPSRAEDRCKVTVTVRRKGKLVERLHLTVRWTGQICFWQKNISPNRFDKRGGGYTARATFRSGVALSKSSTVSW